MKNLVWLVSYPKSGNTWFRMFLANYLGNPDQPVPLEEIESAPIASCASDFEEMIALNPFELMPDEVDRYRPDLCRALSAKAAETGGDRYKKVHDAYTLNTLGEPLFPEEVSRCALYFVRNPLDVCVSYAHHYAGDIGKIVNLLLDEKANIAGHKSGQLRQKLLSWRGHLQSWQVQSGIPVHFARYEDMLQKPEETFGGMVRFLGLELDRERLRRAIRHSDFRLLKQMEEANGFGERLQQSKSFFWKGKIGNYRDHLTVEQIARIVEYNYDTMKEWGYLDEEGRLLV